MLKIKCRTLSSMHCLDSLRCFSSSPDPYSASPRERMFYDAVIVGAGTTVITTMNTFLMVTLHNLNFISATSDIVIPNTTGPAGLSAAIRLKQMALANNKEIRDRKSVV